MIVMSAGDASPETLAAAAISAAETCADEQMLIVVSAGDASHETPAAAAISAAETYADEQINVDCGECR